MLERWSRNPSLRRLLGGVQRDALTAPGERVALAANLGATAKLGALARFYVDAAVVAEVPIVAGSEVLTVIDAPEPGLHRVEVKVCDDGGRVVSDVAGHRLLHVSSGRPVVLVDAELLVPDSPEAAAAHTPPVEALRALVDGGFELAYFDIHEKNREAAIHDEVLRHRLPPGCILVYSAEQEELRNLGVDFVDMFAWKTPSAAVADASAS